MGVRFALVAWFAIGLGGSSLGAQTAQQLQRMLDSNQAFALRDAVARGHAPAFYRGAVEESENRLKAAKRELDRAIAANPHGKEAFEAHEMLSNAHFRDGQFRESLAEAEAAHRVEPDSADLNNTLPLLRVLAEAADMAVVERRSSRIEIKRDRN